MHEQQFSYNFAPDKTTPTRKKPWTKSFWKQNGCTFAKCRPKISKHLPHHARRADDASHNGAFADCDIRTWIERQLQRYDTYGYGLWAAIRKDSGELIGQCGLTRQYWLERQVIEVGYLFRRDHWHKGYATEAAKACKTYAFGQLEANRLCAIIRDTNTANAWHNASA